MDSSFPVGILILFFGLIGLVTFVFWLWMLIDCLTKEPSEGNDKLIWAMIIFFGSILGALIYLFVRRPERIRKFGS